MRSDRVRTGVLVGVGLLAATLGVAAVAWACTAAPYVNVSPPSGAAGTTVTITGGGFQEGPIDLSWTKGGSGAVVLKTETNGPDFAVRVRTDSDWSPDVYYIVATQKGAEAGRASFRLTPGSVEEGSSPGGGAEANGTTSNGTTSAGGGTAGSGQTHSLGGAPGGAGASTPAADPSGPAAPSAGSAEPVATPAAGRRAGTSGGGTPATVTAGGNAGPAPAAAGQSAATASPGAAPAPAAAPTAVSPSRRSVSDDVWGAFASGFDLDAGDAARLDDARATSNGPSAGLVVSMGLTALGFAALLTGLAGAERRRRTSLAAVGRSAD